MARLPRFIIPGQPQYVIQCGNNREVIFAHDKGDPLISPQLLYKRLGRSPNEWQKFYRQLFCTRIVESAIKGIRKATNKSWVLGSDRFKAEIEKLTARQAAPKVREGDRKSENYRKSKIMTPLN